jgi:hypothetical protein
MWEWFWFFVPFEIKIAVVVVFGLAIYIGAGTLFRWPEWITPKWLIWIVAGVATVLGANILAQRGWRAKEARDMKDAGKFIEKARQSRQNAETVVARDKADGKLRENPHGHWRD